VEKVAAHFPELEVLELIGAGGMGAVYKARQPKLDRFVALKILSHDLAEDPAFEERFNRQARVLARLSHPNIVTVFDFGSNGPFCFLLMEYVEGVNLRQATSTSVPTSIRSASFFTNCSRGSCRSGGSPRLPRGRRWIRASTRLSCVPWKRTGRPVTRTPAM
jgi:serine/threonine protein kinase